MKNLLCIFALALSFTVSAAAWPDQAWLRRSVIAGVPAVMAQYDAKTGEFGTKPWICLDQNVLFPLAVAWSIPGPDNPYYHDAKLLAAIAKGGERLVKDQDKTGRWIFRKKDGSTWGMTHMAWTYTRWIRAYMIVKDALPPESRTIWEKGLQLGFSNIAKSLNGSNHVQNIPAYLAAGLYCAGIAFNHTEWKEIAANYLYKVIRAQAPDGFWTEHSGPVVAYNYVYLEALGIYYHYSQDPLALPALQKGARFHAALLWSDNTNISVVDERNPYNRAVRHGNAGFSFTPEGRGYLVRQFGKMQKSGRPVQLDLAASFYQEGASGNAAASAGNPRFDSIDRQFSVSRARDFEWCFSAYSCPIVTKRWIMDRQCHVELFHQKAGLLAGGGNTKMQPFYSTFTFGNPDSFQPDYTTDAPDFKPQTTLRYTADSGTIDGNTLHLVYGKNRAAVTALPEKDGFTLEYKLENTPDAPAMAHLPIVIARAAHDARGSLIRQPQVTGKMIGGVLQFMNGTHIEVPDNAVIRTQVPGFNPYQKYGKGANARIVISLPLDAEHPVQKIRFLVTKAESPVDGSLSFNAPELPVTAKDAPTRYLEDHDTVFLRAGGPGPVMTFTVPVSKAGKYQLFIEYLQADNYGIVQVQVNGKDIGKPFSAYAPGVIAPQPRDIGTVKMKAGNNTVAFKIVNKESRALNHFFSVRAIYLKPAATKR